MNKIKLCELSNRLKSGARLRIICITISLSALITAFLVKRELRPILYDTGVYVFWLLDALPNFLYVFCAAMAIPVIEEWFVGRNWPGPPRFLTLAVAFTAGTISYEIIQVWMPERTFDLLDIAASIVGALAAWQVYQTLLSGQVQASAAERSA